MKAGTQLHRVQISILSLLSRATRARFSELQHHTQLESDRFKYHVRSLVRRGYLIKAPDGLYELSAEGKEFSNRLDEQTGREIEQPKASMLLIVRSKQRGQTYFLAHRRTREPFRGFWGIASAPVLRGVPIREAAARELFKQTGITATFEVVGIQRVIDKNAAGSILEDKLFSVLVADVPECPAPAYWYGGESVWLTAGELLAKDRLFATTATTLAMVERGVLFVEHICLYAKAEY